MNLSFASIALMAHVVAALRIVFFRRNGARHRAHVSWLAWSLASVLGCSAIELALHPRHVDFLEAARSVLLAFFVFCARGNVARLLWSGEQ
ncbi:MULTISPECIES: phage holin family protein [unclassified Caballeronia]|uniref:phage holin family protein n=1 Tax=unclassified Caballeronia TaxID=2646786 RepID=UPI0020294059|nr:MULTISPECIES: phage holin family protein [unclassified Caballeronia]